MKMKSRKPGANYTSVSGIITSNFQIDCNFYGKNHYVSDIESRRGAWAGKKRLHGCKAEKAK